MALVAGSLSGTGSLLYNNDGTFTYTPGSGEEGTVTFQYRITDGDGDPSTATVTINLLEDSTPAVEVGGERVVDEAGLPPRGSEPQGSGEEAAGGANGDMSETTTGTIGTFTGNDTVGTLVINGVNVTNGGTVTTAQGVLTVTLSSGAYTYSYTLTDNTAGDATSDSFSIVLTDSDGDSATDTLVIDIVDDEPIARDDSDSIAAGEFGPATGNVITDAEGDGGRDTAGADGIAVTGVNDSEGLVAPGTEVQGAYGKLTLNGDGSYNYIRDAGTAGGVSDIFTYQITDGDGDTDTATLTIAIGDATPDTDVPAAGGETTTVYEAGLPARNEGESEGSGEEAAAGANGDPREAVSGTIAFTSLDGVSSVTLGGTAINPGGLPQTVASNATGTLVVTSYAFDPATGQGTIGYTYTLADNTSGDDSSASFALVVNDADDNSATDTLTITIVDDVPTARADADSVTEDAFVGEEGAPRADGNVITGLGGSDTNTGDGVADTRGADGATVTGVVLGDVTGPVSGGLGGIAGTYGTLVLNTNGSYSYTLNNSDPRVQGLDSNDTLTEVFTYTISDGDGDPATTTLTITINGSNDPITINGLNVEGPELTVDEDDLADGSDTAPKDPLTQDWHVHGQWRRRHCFDQDRRHPADSGRDRGWPKVQHSLWRV